MKTSSVRYSVSQLLKEPVGSFHDHMVDEEIFIEVGVIEKVSGNLRLARFDEGVSAGGDVEACFDFLCSRCLNQFRQSIKASVYEEFRQAAVEKEGPVLLELGSDTEGFFVNRDDILDLTEPVRQSLLVERPLKPLCRIDCKGICPDCGGDRNMRLCVCETGSKDPRWAALIELFPRSQERG